MSGIGLRAPRSHWDHTPEGTPEELKNGYDGVMIPDHTPHTACDAPWHAGMAWALGYLRSAIDILERE